MDVCLFFLFQSLFFLDLCDLTLELVRVWPFYLFYSLIYSSHTRLGLSEQSLCLIKLTRQLNYLLDFHLFFRL
jgi:hypothetical protein